MKKVFSAAAAAGILTVAATAFAADAIDAGGRATVSIAAPAMAAVKAASPQVSMDSAGVLTAAAPSVVSQGAELKKVDVKNFCLDSDCKTIL